MRRVYSNLNQAASASLGQAAASRTHVRDYSLQNRIPKHVSAECRRGRHSSCYSLNCTCACAHGGGNGARR